MTTPIAFKATTGQDVRYYHESMAALDADNLTDSIIKEVDDHCERNDWDLVLRSKVPTKQNTLDSV